jgi:citronellol/citronellal dehydrogenase
MGSRFESIFRPGLFEGRVAFVTGGGTGLGRCIAHELAALGATVAIGARRREPLERTAAEIAEAGGRCDLVQLNVRDEREVERAVGELVARHGRIDALVNNAGGQFVAPAEQMTPNGWRAVIDLNLNGCFLVSHAVYRHSMRERGGAIVNMLADIWTGYPGMAHMSAARAGIENLTRTLTMEWGRAGVRVNCIAPGTILSAGLATYDAEVQRFILEEGDHLPLGRLGTESEVSAAVVFLLSPAAAYVSGETLRVDGGAQFHKRRLLPVGHHRRSRPYHGFHLPPALAGTPFEALLEHKGAEP